MSKKGFLQVRRQALEEEFFARHNAKLVEEFNKEKVKSEKKKEFSKILGIKDDEILEELHELQMTTNSLCALSIVPLVQVAWADGKIDEKEKEAIMKAAVENGVKKGEDSYELLQDWLFHEPSANLYIVWKNYAKSLFTSISKKKRENFKRCIIDRAKEVADASGGFLGLTNRVSKSERIVLDKLEETFSEEE